MKEKEALKVAMEYEKEKGRKPVDVSNKKLGHDIESSGRVIEVKARDFPKRRFIHLTQREFESFLKRENCWLYIVTPERKVIEISRDKVLKAAKPKIDWRISLRKEIVENVIE